MNIILIGFKKSGKTTIGKLLSFLLKKRFVDIDDIIKKMFEEFYHEKKEIFDIYQSLQEKSFRQLETLAFQRVKNIKNCIVATSGGCVLNNKNLKFFKYPKIIVYLKASKQKLKNRIQEGKNSIFSNNDLFESQYDKRKNLYKNIADFTFESDSIDFVKLSKQIIEKLNV